MVQMVIRATTVGCNVIFFRYYHRGSSCLLERVSNVSSVVKSILKQHLVVDSLFAVSPTSIMV